MPYYAAFLRGVNVGGNKMVAMADLRSVMEDAGFSNVKTLLQSGNVVFETQEHDTTKLEERLEATCANRLGLETRIFVRSKEDLKLITDQNPFPYEAETEPGHLLVVFLKGAPEAGDVEALNLAIRGPEKIACLGSQCYVVYPDGIGTSNADKTPGWKALLGQGTGRNWNTVRKVLAAMA